ncbi:stage III sporulation protein AG [Paenibacillus thermoaerophilus]|uniref:Stage III sporulation protein AG n=1 Tax=Paenibacillus thermoaerophilus TaxID=1215385 RepID=A0ABW2V6G1_9BACL|nr:stage III sporulation protein AG [Paenibacillus thermoaerophilus]TMV18787.1 stage III sporulation protein AG [Paenibacillus thermoaerophilus]
MANWLNRLEKTIGGGDGGGGRRVAVFRWLLLAGLGGAAFMLLSDFAWKDVAPIGGPPRASPQTGAAQSADEQAAADRFRETERIYQEKLKTLLEKIVGVGEVDVAVTLESTEEMVLQQNNRDTQQTIDERDTNGTSRQTSNITREGEALFAEQSGTQTPVVVKTIKPKVRGVIVVARGAENPTVKLMLSEAVSRGLDVPAHRISVLPRKQ